MQNIPQAKLAFMSWLKTFSPPLYYRVIGESRLNGIFDVFTNIDWDNVIDTTVDLGANYLNYDNQKDVLKLQAERAKANQLPRQTLTANEIAIVRQQQTPQQLQTERLTNQLLVALPWILGGLIVLNFMRPRA